MGFLKPARAPAPPDPRETAQAQTGTSIGSAIASAMLGGVDQVTPYGTTTRQQTGTYAYEDPYTGQTYDIPTFTQTTELSPEQQQLLSTTQAAQQSLADVARAQAGRVGERLGDPLALGNEAVEARLYELGRGRLDPQFAQQRASLEQRLANQGITPGSEAYNRAMTLQNQRETDAYNQLLLRGRGQATQELLAERSQPLNELSALLSQSQVTQPNFQQIGMPQIATTDVAGLIGQNYQAQLANWQNAERSRQGLLGGLFGLGGDIAAGAGAAGGIGALFSDRKVKTNIRPVGKLDNGLTVYAYNYIWGGPPRIGVMAQEVEEVNPEAVRESPRGVKLVDYDKAVL